MKDADGIMFVLDPAAPQGDDQLAGFHRAFMTQMNMRPQQAFLFVNHHNKAGARQLPDADLPKQFADIDKVVGSAEDSGFVVSGFEKYFAKLLKEVNERQKADEN